MILPLNVSTALTAATPLARCLTLDAHNPDYDATPGVPVTDALLTGAALACDSDGVIVELGVSDADGSNFVPVIPAITGDELNYPEGRARFPFTALRRPAVRLTSKTTQTARVAGHVEFVSVATVR